MGSSRVNKGKFVNKIKSPRNRRMSGQIITKKLLNESQPDKGQDESKTLLKNNVKLPLREKNIEKSKNNS